MSIKQEVFAASFTTLNDFEAKANALGRQGWKLFSFIFIPQHGYLVTAVWTKLVSTTMNGYGQMVTEVVQ